MNFKHELVVPNEDLSFRMFLFEGFAGNYSVAKHWHRSIEIFAVYEGEMDYYINNTAYHLAPGNFVLLNSNEIHSIDCPNKNKTIVLQIPLKTFEKYYVDEQYILFSHSPREQDKQIMGLIQHMFEVYKNQKMGYELKVQSQYFMLLYQLVSKYRIDSIEKKVLTQNKNLNRLSSITNYLKEHYKEELSLDYVAKIFGYSPSYLSRMFQKYALVNYKDFLQEIRVEAAYRDLINSKETICSIAMEHGFPNTKAFSKVFLKKYGKLPSEYRKTSLKK